MSNLESSQEMYARWEAEAKAVRAQEAAARKPSRTLPRFEGTRTFTLPPTFWFDHLSRDLRCGEGCPEQEAHQGEEGTVLKSGVRVNLSWVDANELFTDAEYYRSAGVQVFGQESLGLVASARGTVTRLLK